ncbi:MAG: type II toxin-antitoxin system VapC family toxin [candidate division KSB1 bacterium]|nr:type II toxin-antitoxin system VapC family toxin [candidate division KSB1 bacterium]MDZ7319211.1 type II toxin-antitoxin system VapC family toxin [candidate division KSB1 bacterium]
MAEQVIDASVAIKWVVKGEPYRNKARQLLRDAKTKGIALISPPLLEYEVESVLQYRLHQKRVSQKAVDASLNAFYAVGVQIIIQTDMVRRAREIARQSNQERVYDSIYAALAELRSCEFWTADKAFYDAVKSKLVFVKYLPDYLG